jgi:hypothetical protein
MHLSLFGLNRLCKGLIMLHKTDFMCVWARGLLIIAGHRLAKQVKL